MNASGRYMLVGAMAGMLGVAATGVPAWGASITEVEFDVNSITIQAMNGAGQAKFDGLTHTGSLSFTKDGDSTIALSIDGVDQSSAFTATFLSFSGQVNLINGVSQGGSMSIQVLNPDNSVDSYTFDLAPGEAMKRPKGKSSFYLLGFQLDADTLHGFFNNTTYGGVDVSPWYDGQVPGGLNGAFFELKYTPDLNGYSNSSDVDVIALTDGEVTGNGSPSVPLPSSAAAGLGLIGLLAIAKWRRSVG